MNGLGNGGIVRTAVQAASWARAGPLRHEIAMADAMIERNFIGSATRRDAGSP
jgi:hypothetical protein